MAEDQLAERTADEAVNKEKPAPKVTKSAAASIAQEAADLVQQATTSEVASAAEEAAELLKQATEPEREAIQKSIENLNTPSFFRRFAKSLKQAVTDQLASLGRTFYGLTLAFVIAVLSPVLMTGMVSDKLETLDSKLDSNVTGALNAFTNSDAMHQFSQALESQVSIASAGQTNLNQHVEQFEGVLANSGETLQAQLETYESWMGQVDTRINQLMNSLNQLQGQTGSLNELLQNARTQERSSALQNKIGGLQAEGQRFLSAANRADDDYQAHRQWLKTVLYLAHSMPIANANLTLLQNNMQTVMAGEDEFARPAAQIQEALTVLEVLALLTSAS